MELFAACTVPHDEDMVICLQRVDVHFDGRRTDRLLVSPQKGNSTLSVDQPTVSICCEGTECENNVFLYLLVC